MSFQYIFHSEDGGFEELTGNMKSTKFAESDCDEFHSKILGDRLLGSTPYFYPFIVEFALIGASVAYIMSNHIGARFLKRIIFNTTMTIHFVFLSILN